jgi:hypothetical protein
MVPLIMPRPVVSVSPRGSGIQVIKLFQFLTRLTLPCFGQQVSEDAPSRGSNLRTDLHPLEHSYS